MRPDGWGREGEIGVIGGKHTNLSHHFGAEPYQEMKV